MFGRGLGWRGFSSFPCTIGLPRDAWFFSHTMAAGSKSNYLKRQEVEAASHLRAWD